MMPLKCFVSNCCSNYKSSDCKISVNKFPREVSEKNEFPRKQAPSSPLSKSCYTEPNTKWLWDSF